MAIFSNNLLGTTLVEANENYNLENHGDFDAFMESYDDDLAIIEAMHAYDMAELQGKIALENASEFDFETVEEGNFNDLKLKAEKIWEKIKTWLKNLWGKIKGFFENAIKYLDSVFMSGKAFAEKYADKVGGLNLSGFEHKMFVYKNTDGKALSSANSTITDASKRVLSLAKKISAGATGDKNSFDQKMNQFDSEIVTLKEKLADSLRSALVGNGSADQYTTELFKHFRNGKSERTDVKISSVGPLFKFLAKSEDYLKDAVEAKKATGKLFEDAIKAVEEVESKVKSNDKVVEGGNAKAAAVVRKLLTVFSSLQGIRTSYVNAWSSAVKEQTGAYKSACFKAMTYKAKK